MDLCDTIIDDLINALIKQIQVEIIHGKGLSGASLYEEIFNFVSLLIDKGFSLNIIKTTISTIKGIVEEIKYQMNYNIKCFSINW